MEITNGYQSEATIAVNQEKEDTFHKSHHKSSSTRNYDTENIASPSSLGVGIMGRALLLLPPKKADLG